MPKGKNKANTKKPSASQIILAIFSIIIVLSVILSLFFNPY
jgi:hypothetical protein